MAEHPSSSKAINSSSGTCLTSTRIIHLSDRQLLCMKCFANTIIESNRYRLIITHHFTNGPYNYYKCAKCNSDLVISRPHKECLRCSQKYTELLSKIPKDKIDMNTITFRLNIFTDNIEGLTPIDLQSCQSPKYC